MRHVSLQKRELEMSVHRSPSGARFPLPVLSSEEVGWRGKLSKWQWALVFGLPLAAVAAVAGLTLIIGRRRRRETGGEQTPPPSMSPTPVASPTSTTLTKATEPSPRDRTQELKLQGNSLFKQGKLEEAVRCYGEAIQMGTGCADQKSLVANCHQNLAAVYGEMIKRDTDPDQKTSHQELVIENCDRAIAIDPRYVKALLRRFKVHQALGHKEEALLDVTRVLLLDESHAQSLSTSVTTLLRDLSQAEAAKNFPTMEPLPPTKYLVRTYCESYIWKDDISEERLKALWLQAHTPAMGQSETACTVQDSVGQESEQNATSEQEERERWEVDGEEGEREAEGNSDEVKGKAEEGVDGERGDEVGEREGEGEREEGEEEGVGKEEGEKEERVVEEAGGEGETVNGVAEDTVEGWKVSAMTGFEEEPFVQAAAQFQNYDLTGILDLLSQAMDRGHAVFKAHGLLLRGTLYALWRMENEALRDLQEVINTQGLPNEMYVNALIKRAGIFAGRLSLDKCKTCLEKALIISPHSTDILVHRARVSLETEDVSNLDTVISDLSKAVIAAPDQPYALYSLASSYHRLAGINQSMQLIETARIKFQDALKKFPKFADGLILYALFLQDMGDFQQAEQVLNKVVQIEPDNPLGHFSIGLLQLVVRSDLNQTMVHMQKAIAVDISCVQAYDTIASIEMQRGNTSRAVELYEKAVRYSRNQVEMTQAYVAQKVFSMQDRVCKEYGVSIQQLASRSALTTASPAT